MSHNIYLCQVNNSYGDNVFLPYSVGLLQAYCQTIPEIAKNFSFKGPFYLRENVDKVAKGLKKPKVMAISSYIWNWEYNKALAQAIKRRYPDCLIVMGGPQVPLRSDFFFIEHPYIDLLVHYEGEISFSEILLESLKERPDYTLIEGISVKVDGNHCYQTPKRGRLADLAQIPSPYLSGVFDELMSEPYSFHASQETHRGCPYSCTFCDWGSAVFSKVRPFSDERLYDELDWFGQNKIELLYNCDANYGLLNRDYALTEKLVATKKKHGFPKQFRAAYAKNSNMKIFELAQLLNDAQMSKGVTLSMQSMNSQTLDFIKRSNIKVTDFENLMQSYRAEKIPTYTELIMGLPGETYDSFLNGIDELLRAGQHDSLNIYLCALLPNSEMSNPEYLRRYEISSIRAPILLQHSTPSDDEIVEYNDIVVGTKTLKRDEWINTYLFAWAVQSLHCLSLTQYVSVLLYHEFGVSYRTFYERLIEFARKSPSTLLGSQYTLVSSVVDRVLHGGKWDIVIPKFGNTTWPCEEATFLNIVCEKDRFYRAIAQFAHQLKDNLMLNLDEELLNDLIGYQKNMTIDPFSKKRFGFTLNHNLHSYFLGIHSGDRIPLSRGCYLLTIDGEIEFGGDLQTYAQKIVWYGRKGGRFKHLNVSERESKQEVKVV